MVWIVLYPVDLIGVASQKRGLRLRLDIPNPPPPIGSAGDGLLSVGVEAHDEYLVAVPSQDLRTTAGRQVPDPCRGILAGCEQDGVADERGVGDPTAPAATSS